VPGHIHDDQSGCSGSDELSVGGMCGAERGNEWRTVRKILQ